jgi:hypothetical protein
MNSLLDGIQNVTNNATSPEYNNKRKREGEAKDKHNQQQANVAKSIDTNISGSAPNGNSPKRDPNDIGKGAAIAVGVGVTLGIVEQITNPDPSKDAHEAHLEKEQQQQQNNNSFWDKIPKWFSK